MLVNIKAMDEKNDYQLLTEHSESQFVFHHYVDRSREENWFALWTGKI